MQAFVNEGFPPSLVATVEENHRKNKIFIVKCDAVAVRKDVSRNEFNLCVR
jgi:hypothetical protein